MCSVSGRYDSSTERDSELNNPSDILLKSSEGVCSTWRGRMQDVRWLLEVYDVSLMCQQRNTGACPSAASFAETA